MVSLAPAAALPRPRLFQFRIATLLIAMIWVGLVSLGLRNPTSVWAGASAALTLLATLTAILIAIYRTGRVRAAAIGFVIFCGGFLLISSNYYLFPGIGPGSTIAQLFSILATSMHGESTWTNDQWVVFPITVFSSEPPYYRGNFIAICNHALACILGIAGAITAQMLYATRRDERSPQNHPP
jgi:hypothetical protein